jgi:two-component system, response regulator YesN
MYKVLIADDEKWVRKGISTTIDWQKYGIDTILEAKDGEEALELAKEHKPELIITDIKMPNLDGLEFITEFRKYNEHTKIIIISGYSEFEFAKRAIKLGASDYLMKPIEETVLDEIISKCTSEIVKDRDKRLDVLKSADNLKEYMPLAQNYYLSMLLTQNIENIESVNTKLKSMNIDLNLECLTVVSLDIDYDSGDRSIWEKADDLAKFAIKNILQEFLEKSYTFYIVDISDKRMVCLISGKCEEQNAEQLNLKNILCEAVEAVKRFLKCNLTAGIAKANTIEHVFNSYRESQGILEYRFFYGALKVFDYEEANRNLKQKISDIININYGTLVNDIKMGEKENVLATLADLFKDIKLNLDKLSPVEVKPFLMNLTIRLYEALTTADPLMSGFISAISEIEGSLGNLSTIDEVFDYIKEFVLTNMEYAGQHQNKKKKSIEDALKYISAHYSEDITMNSIAKALFLNPSYFSKIFNEYVGQTFSEYLTKVRMNYAKELLKVSYLKVYEVAEKVGYSDYRHFTKKFKELMGISPIEYRDRMQ